MIPDDVEWAQDNDAGGFEDALQITCSGRYVCVLFGTLDQDIKGMYGTYIKVLTIA